MRPFWKRRHPIVRVAVLTLVLIPILPYSFFIHPIIQRIKEEGPGLLSGLKEEYRYAWRTPQDK